MLILKLNFSKFRTFKCFRIAIYWPHNDHDASWQNAAHVNVSVGNFTMLRLFIVLFKDWLIYADTCLKQICLTSFFFVAEKLWLVTGISSLLWTLITFCGRSAGLLFSLTNPCVTNFMILCCKTYVLFYTTTRVASLLTIIWESILIFCSF